MSHVHTYYDLLVDGVSTTIITSTSDEKTCPSGHTRCQLVDAVPVDFYLFDYSDPITSASDHSANHTHTYQKLNITNFSSTRPVRAAPSACPLGHSECRYFNVQDLADYCTAYNYSDEQTSTPIWFDDGSHYHTYSVCAKNLITPLLSVGTCPSGHALCQVVSVGSQGFLAIDSYGDGYTSLIDNIFLVETLPAGWDADIETKAPPVYIDKTWALVRGELVSIDAGDKSVYLAMEYWNIPSNVGTQWYNPPDGATTIYDPITFSVNLGGLSPNMTYYYRAKVQLGSEINVALLNGQVTLSDEYEGLYTECYFEWGEDTGYGNETSHTDTNYSTSFSSIVTGLAVGTTYHYRAVASNAYNTLYGDDETFTILGIYYGDTESFSTPAIPPIVFGTGQGYDYVTSRKAAQRITQAALGRTYTDKEGNLVYESRNVRA